MPTLFHCHSFFGNCSCCGHSSGGLCYRTSFPWNSLSLPVHFPYYHCWLRSKCKSGHVTLICVQTCCFLISCRINLLFILAQKEGASISKVKLSSLLPQSSSFLLLPNSSSSIPPLVPRILIKCSFWNKACVSTPLRISSWYLHQILPLGSFSPLSAWRIHTHPSGPSTDDISLWSPQVNCTMLLCLRVCLTSCELFKGEIIVYSSGSFLGLMPLNWSGRREKKTEV